MTDTSVSGDLPPISAAEVAEDPPVDPRLLEILVCPLSKAPLEYDREARELVSRQAGLAYPVRDGVPIMLIDEARRLDDAEPLPGPGRA